MHYFGTDQHWRFGALRVAIQGWNTELCSVEEKIFWRKCKGQGGSRRLPTGMAQARWSKTRKHGLSDGAGEKAVQISPAMFSSFDQNTNKCEPQSFTDPVLQDWVTTCPSVSFTSPSALTPILSVHWEDWIKQHLRAQQLHFTSVVTRGQTIT